MRIEDGKWKIEDEGSMMEDRKLNKERESNKSPIITYKNLEVFQLSYQLAMEIFWITKSFPKEEKYSLTGQVLESSRSVPANIAEGYAKRRYENVFKRHLNDALGSCDETMVWLDFAKDCKYLLEEKHKDLIERYEEVGAKIFRLMENWKTYV